jgi:hypothetical protein
VAGGVLGRYRIPAEVLYHDPAALGDGLEAHVHLGFLAGSERGGSPREHEPVRGLPDPDPPYLDYLTVIVGLGDAPADARFDGHATAGAAAGQEQAVGPPPLADLRGEGLEDPGRRCRDPQRHENPGGHAPRST